jgi:hypothetical protein
MIQHVDRKRTPSKWRREMALLAAARLLPSDDNSFRVFLMIENEIKKLTKLSFGGQFEWKRERERERD